MTTPVDSGCVKMSTKEFKFVIIDRTYEPLWASVGPSGGSCPRGRRPRPQTWSAPSKLHRCRRLRWRTAALDLCSCRPPAFYFACPQGEASLFYCWITCYACPSCCRKCECRWGSLDGAGSEGTSETQGELKSNTHLLHTSPHGGCMYLKVV